MPLTEQMLGWIKPASDIKWTHQNLGNFYTKWTQWKTLHNKQQFAMSKDKRELAEMKKERLKGTYRKLKEKGEKSRKFALKYNIYIRKLALKIKWECTKNLLERCSNRRT